MRIAARRIASLAAFAQLALGGAEALAMKWQKLSDAELIAGAALIVRGEIVAIHAPEGVATSGRDGASVATVQVLRTFKGTAVGQTLRVLYWSDAAPPGQSAFSKYESPRHYRVGEQVTLTLARLERKAFAELLQPDDAAGARWMHAWEKVYDRQIAAGAFQAALERGASGK